MTAPTATTVQCPHCGQTHPLPVCPPRLNGAIVTAPLTDAEIGLR